MDSSLSTVPPVWPRPRPDIFAVFAPQAATIGARIRLVLSPTPPVECLSTESVPNSDRSISSPECAIASVSVAISRSLMLWKTTAMQKALIW